LVSLSLSQGIWQVWMRVTLVGLAGPLQVACVCRGASADGWVSWGSANLSPGCSRGPVMDGPFELYAGLMGHGPFQTQKGGEKETAPLLMLRDAKSVLCWCVQLFGICGRCH